MSKLNSVFIFEAFSFFVVLLFCFIGWANQDSMYGGAQILIFPIAGFLQIFLSYSSPTCLFGFFLVILNSLLFLTLYIVFGFLEFDYHNSDFILSFVGMIVFLFSGWLISLAIKEIFK